MAARAPCGTAKARDLKRNPLLSVYPEIFMPILPEVARGPTSFPDKGYQAARRDLCEIDEVRHFNGSKER